MALFYSKRTGTKRDGQCKFLDGETNNCSIYKDRPLFCRIDDAYEQVFHKQFSKEEYYKLNAEACNQLQVKLRIGEEYRVSVGQ